MTGELITTGVTFGAGRNSINNAFSGTAEFNNITLDSGAIFSGGNGGAILSGGTDLYDIFQLKTKYTHDYGTTGVTLSWDVLNDSKTAKVILSANTVLSVKNATSGDFGTIEIIQNVTGSNSVTFGDGTNKVANGGAGSIVLTTSGNSIDVASFFYDGSVFFWDIKNNYT